MLIQSAVPLGQPIPVGHHSERRARRHAQKIENGMKRAVMLFERAEYWEQRAQASLRHAKYKERPDALPPYQKSRRNYASPKSITRSEKYMTMACADARSEMALLVSNYDHIYACSRSTNTPPGREKPV